MWTVTVDKDKRVFLSEEEFTETKRLYVEGNFTTFDDHTKYAVELAMKLNGTYKQLQN
jgi:hypothetical protein